MLDIKKYKKFFIKTRRWKEYLPKASQNTSVSLLACFERIQQ